MAKLNFSNSGASTLNINGLGAKTIKKTGGSADVATGDLLSGGLYNFVYDGTYFQCAELNSTVVDGSITFAKLQDIPTDSLIGRDTAGTGDAESITLGGGLGLSGAQVLWGTLRRRNIADITSGDTIVASDRAKLINITTGTGTLAFTAASTLQDGFYCIIKNSGTGDVTLDPNSTEQIDGLTSWKLYPGGSIFVECDGTDFYSVLLSAMQVTFNVSGTFTRPGVGTWVDIEAVGGGGSGGRGTGDTGGGGGGGQNAKRFLRTALGTTETVTIGAGGAARSTTQDGATGGDTSFGSLLSAFGGGGGDNAGNGGGGGGGPASAGSIPTASGGGAPGLPNFTSIGGLSGARQGDGGDASVGSRGWIHGGGGGDGAFNGGPSTHGGGGGAGCNATTAATGGVSQFAGNGGASAVNGANATAGSAPGGGGGAAEAVATGISGAGADGQVVVRIH